MNFEKPQSFYDFTDRTVLVTGGAGVLGLEIVHTLVECNANVIILSRNHERAAKSVAELFAAYPRQCHRPWLFRRRTKSTIAIE